MSFDPNIVKKDFPILAQKVYGKDYVYLDNAATSLRPQPVIDVINKFYSLENSSVHRGGYYYGQLATERFENARENVKTFLGAAQAEEIIFTRGTTESVNLVATSLMRSEMIQDGDEILISQMEHHSNIVPWQLIKFNKNISIKMIPIDKDGNINLDAYQSLLGPKVKLLAIVHVSNTLGTINPIKKMAQLAHQNGAMIFVDGAQAVSHLKVDVQDLDADFYAFSGHKIFGPTGIGVLYGKQDILNALPPYHGGGSMIERVTFEKTTYADLPNKFEAGTPNIAGVFGLSAAIDYFKSFDLESVEAHEKQLLNMATTSLNEISGLKILGNPQSKTGVISFNIDGVHASDIGTYIDQLGIAVRTGHHCTQPLMDFYQASATVRASFSIYNTITDIEKLISGLAKAVEFFNE